PPFEQEQAWAEALIGRMSQAPAPSLVPVVTPGVRVLEADFAGDGWTIALQVGSGFGSAMERLLVGGVVRSLVDSTPGATSVRLSLVGPDGQAWQSQHLDLSRPLEPAEMANMLGDPGRGGLAATVWWRVAGTEALAPVRVPLVGQAGTPPADALALLAAGPPAEASAFLAGVAPGGSTPAWKGLEGAVATVDLAAPPEGAAGERFVAATALTLTEFEGVEAVRFTVQGAPATGLAGPFALNEPVERPDMVNPVSPEAWPTPEARP
ncbi:MAG: GerMN domain-containing protein, partial [Candidatus Sericytochromatia bacterium]